MFTWRIRTLRAITSAIYGEYSFNRIIKPKWLRSDWATDKHHKPVFVEIGIQQTENSRVDCALATQHMC